MKDITSVSKKNKRAFQEKYLQDVESIPCKCLNYMARKIMLEIGRQIA
jgi:hypothetical protein